MEQVGILVHGDNHFIVRGPRPSRGQVLALVRHWSLIQIGGAAPEELNAWRISTREFREDLTWAVVVTGDRPVSDAVQMLLSELEQRGVAIEKNADTEPRP